MTLRFRVITPLNPDTPGLISGPFYDDNSSDKKIFGKTLLKEKKDEIPVHLYVGAHFGIRANLKGSEAISRNVDVENICGNLYSFEIILNFQNLNPLVPEKKQSDSNLFNSFATPSNMELTIGTFSSPLSFN